MFANPKSKIQNLKLMDGLLIIDKPEGWTSHDVVARVRRVLRTKRVGHTGTLDPFATGVLVVMVGRATRLAQFLAGDVKEYEAVVRFGYETLTGDVTGARKTIDDESEAIRDRVRARSEEEIEKALGSLRGEIEQVPPMYSAKKIEGKKLYELARRGLEVERAARRVTIYELEAVRHEGQLLVPLEDGTCELKIRVECSAGTYVRVLAEEIGARLGVGAHLSALRRTRAGGFDLDNALTLEELEKLVEAGEAAGALLSTDAALSPMPFRHLTSEEARRTMNGVPLRLDRSEAALYRDGEHVRLRDEVGNLLAVSIYDEGREALRPVVVLGAEEK